MNKVPVCVFGQRTDTPTGKAPDYDGPDHCAACHAEVLRMLGEQSA
jgi:hypothetical protein